MNILAITKGIAGTAASLGVGTIVGNAVKATTPTDITKYQKVIVGIGGLALTAVVGEAVTRHTEDKVDEFSKVFSRTKDDNEDDASVEEN